MDDELHESWARLLGSLQRASQRVDELTVDRDASERAEGHRFLTRVLSAMTDFYMEQDADQPSLVRIMTPTRKFYGDNPDTLYDRVALRPDRSYRVRGRRGNDLYMAFCVYGLQGTRNAILANVSDRDLSFDTGGSFELTLSAQPPVGGGNWLELAPNARSMVVRQYFIDHTRIEPARLQIEMLGEPTPANLPAPAQVARRLRATGEAVERTLAITAEATAAWMARPNELSMDSDAAGLSGLFPTPDNRYVGGWYRLEENQALVITGQPPVARYWSAQLWSRWLESREYRWQQVSLNHSQIQLESDGSFRIVIAHRPPNSTGSRNWLDTSGHREGCVVLRWLQAEHTPPPPIFRVVDVEALR